MRHIALLAVFLFGTTICIAQYDGDQLSNLKRHYINKRTRLIQNYKSCSQLVRPGPTTSITAVEGNKRCTCRFEGTRMRVNCSSLQSNYVYGDGRVSGNIQGPYLSSNLLQNAQNDLTNIGHNLGFTHSELSKQTAKLSCPYPTGGGTPESISWNKGGKLIADFRPPNTKRTTSKYEINDDGSLIIKNVALNDAGEYECKAYFAGRSGVEGFYQQLSSPTQARITFTKLRRTDVVEYIVKWRIRGSNGPWTEIRLEPNDHPSVLLTDLEPETEYEVSVVAMLPTNVVQPIKTQSVSTTGTPGRIVVPQVVPQYNQVSHQYRVLYSNIGTTSLEIRVETNDQHISAEYYREMVDEEPTQVNFVNNEAVIENLEPDQGYFFDFYTLDRSGNKVPINQISGHKIRTSPELTYGPEPRVITWPIDWGSYITNYYGNYVIEYKPSNSYTWTRQQSNEPTITLENINPATSYDIQVYTMLNGRKNQKVYDNTVITPSLSSVITRDDTDPVEIVVPDLVEPSANNEQFYTATGDGHVLLTWERPEQDRYLDYGYEFNVGMEKIGGISEVMSVFGTSTELYLEPGSTYKFTVVPTGGALNGIPIPFVIESFPSRVEPVAVDVSDDDGSIVEIYPIVEETPVETIRPQPAPQPGPEHREPLNVRIQGTEGPYSIGNRVEMTCAFLDPREHYYILWYKDDIEIPGATSRYLDINSFTQNDAGVYKCSVLSSNFAGSAVRDVFAAENVPNPQNLNPSNIRSTGFQLTWSGPDDWVNSDKYKISYYPLSENSAPIKTSEQGSFTYTFKNLKPQTLYHITVYTVRRGNVSPGESIVVATIQEVSVQQGERAVIQCNSNLANPDYIDWYKDDKPILHVANQQITRREGFPERVNSIANNLEFGYTIPDDEGKYRCVATKGTTSEEIVTLLSVDQCEDAGGRCYIDPCEIPRNRVCQNYDAAQCVPNYCRLCNSFVYVTNSGDIVTPEMCNSIPQKIEHATSAVPVVEPTPTPEIPPPTTLKSYTGTTIARVVWKPPRGYNKIGYQVKYYPEGAPEDATTKETTARGMYIRELTDATTYIIEIRTKADDGLSEPLSGSFTTERLQNTTPPKDVNIQNVQSDSFDVRFTADQYPHFVDVIKSTDNSLVKHLRSQPGVSVVHVDGLGASQRYKIQVWKDRDGTPSVKSTLYQETLPMTPTNVQLVDSTADSFTLTWDDDTTGLVTHYRLLYRPELQPGNLQTTQTTSNQITLTDLEPNTIYLIDVSASSRNQDSKPSQHTFATQPLSITFTPDTPTPIIEVEGDTLNLGWDVVEDVDKYILKFNNEANEEPEKVIEILNPLAAEKEFIGMTPGPYTGSLVAVSNDVESEPAPLAFEIPVQPVSDLRVTDTSPTGATFVWTHSPTKYVDDSVKYKVEFSHGSLNTRPLEWYTSENHDTISEMDLNSDDVYIIKVYAVVQTRLATLESEPVSTSFIPAIAVESPKELVVAVSEEEGSPLVVKWMGVPMAEEYEVAYYPLNNPSAKQTVHIGNPEQTSVKLSDVDYNTEYVVEVTTIVGGEKSDPTVKYVTTRLPATGSLSPNLINEDDSPEPAVELIWSEVNGADGYQVAYTPVDETGSPVGNEVVITRQWYDGTKVTLESLEPGTTYEIEVTPFTRNRANQVLGEPTKVNIETPLSAPLHTNVRPATDDQSGSSTVDISWDPVPSAKEYEVTYYPVFGNGGHGTTKTVTVDASQNTVSIDSLYPGANYEIVVTPISSTKKPGETATQKVVTPLPAPQASSTEQVVSPDTEDTTINARWQDVFGAEKYEVKYYPTDDTSSQITVEVPYSKNTYTFEDMMPGTHYTIEITPLSDGGNRGNTATTHTITPIDNPTNMEVVVNENILDVSWDKPDAEVTQYEVKATPIDKPGQTIIELVDGDDHGARLTGLIPNTEYVVSVTAFNNDLDLTSKPLSDEVTTDSITNLPAVVQPRNDLEPNAEGLYTIRWNQPEHLPEMFRIIYSKPGSTPAENIVENTVTEVGLDLEPNSEYTVIVQAPMTTSLEEPSEKDSMEITINTGIPQVPLHEVTDNTDTSATVDWGQPVQSEYIDYVTLKLFEEGTNEPINVQNAPISLQTTTYEGLAPDTAYTVVLTPFIDGDEGIPSMQEFRTAPLTSLEPVSSVRAADVTPEGFVIDWDLNEDHQPMYRLSIVGPETYFDNVFEPYVNTYTYTGAIPGTNYKVSVSAILGDIESEPTNIDVKTPLSAPTQLENTEVESTSATLTWQPSAFGETPNYYRVDLQPKDNPAANPVSFNVPGQDTEIFVTNLAPGTTYTVTVRALDTDTNQFSEGLTSTIKTKEESVTTPNPIPEGTQRFRPESEIVMVEWEPSRNPVKDGYNVVYTDDNGDTKVITVPSETSSVILDNLTPGGDYNIYVTTVLETGMQEPATVTEIKPVDIPDKDKFSPVSQVIEGPNSGEVLIRWVLPQTSPEGTPIDNVFVSYNNEGLKEISMPSTATTAIIKDLEPGENYPIHVSYISGGKKYQIEEPEFVHMPTKQINVQWYPSNPRNNVKEYVVYYKESGSDMKPEAVTVPKNVSSVTITGLKPSADYDIDVMAMQSNNNRFKILPQEVKEETPTQKSHYIYSPNNIGARVDGDMATVDWVTNQRNVHLVTNYKVEFIPVDNKNADKITAFLPASKESHVVSGLQPQTTYDVNVTSIDTVRGKNSGGTIIRIVTPEMYPLGHETGFADDFDEYPTFPSGNNNKPFFNTPRPRPAPQPLQPDLNRLPNTGHPREPEEGPEPDTSQPASGGEAPSAPLVGPTDKKPTSGVHLLRTLPGKVVFNWATTDEPDYYSVEYQPTGDTEWMHLGTVPKSTSWMYFPEGMELNTEYTYRIIGKGGDLPRSIPYLTFTVTQDDNDGYELYWQTTPEWNAGPGSTTFVPEEEEPKITNLLPTFLDNGPETDYNVLPLTANDGSLGLIPELTEEDETEFTKWVTVEREDPIPGVGSPTSVQLLWTPQEQSHSSVKQFYDLEIEPVNGNGNSYRSTVPAFSNFKLPELNPGVLYRFIVREKNGEVVKSFYLPAHTSLGRRLGYYNVADVRVQEFIGGQLLVEWPQIENAVRYIVEYTVNGELIRNELTNASIILPPLEPGEIYQLRVIAEIDGDEIPIYMIRIQRKYTGPPIVETLRYETSSYSVITLMWERMLASIDGLRVRYGREETVDGRTVMVEPITERVLSPNTTRFEVSDLEPGNNYQITLETFKDGAYSSPLTLHVFVPVPTVTRYMFTQLNASQMRIHWEQLQIPGGTVQYEIFVKSDSGYLIPPTLLEGTNTEYTITGLQPDVQYTFVIRTKYGDKYSKESELKFWLLERTTEITTRYIRSGTWTISWQGDSSAVDSWKIEAEPLNGNAEKIVIDNINRNVKSHTLSGLQENVQYRIKVYGVRGNLTSLPITSTLPRSGTTTHTQTNQQIATTQKLLNETRISIGENRFIASFTPMTNIGRVDYYTVGYRKEGTTDFVYKNFAPSRSQLTTKIAMPLEGQGTYEISLKATKGGVTGKDHRANITIAPPPVDQVSFAQSDGSLYIRWRAVSYPVQGYLLSYTYSPLMEEADLPDPPQRSIFISPTRLEIFEQKVPNLSAGVAAEYNVVAITREGEQSRKKTLKLRAKVPTPRKKQNHENV